MFEVIIAILVILLVSYLIIKKFDTVISLLFGGIILLFCAYILKYPILNDKLTTGSGFFDIFEVIKNLFIKNLGNIGLTIMVLFGYSTYMNSIEANDVTIHMITKPIKNIRFKYLLIPIIFLLSNLLSLIVPSASSLAVLLMATLFPILTSLKITPLTAAAIIATSATIMPTPLGADNIFVSESFGINLMEYVKNHSMISIPTIFIMAITHYIWQKFLDRKELKIENIETATKNTKKLKPIYYGILPVLPLILVILNYIFMKNIKLSLVVITFICFFISIIVDILYTRDISNLSSKIQTFFKGMGQGMSQVVILLVAAGTLVEGLKAIGIIRMLTDNLTDMSNVGVVVPLVFSGITAIIGFISGSGLSVFYATVPLMKDIATASNIDPQIISLPMQMIANLIRSISPVSAVIVIIATTIKTTPLKIIKRTSVPIIVGIISVILLSYITLM